MTILVGAPAFGWIADHLGGYHTAWAAVAGLLVVAVLVPGARVAS